MPISTRLVLYLLASRLAKKGGVDVMDYAQIAQMIGTLGFPIVACGALFWLINKNETARRQDNKFIEDSRREDNAKFIEAINNNTMVMTKVLDKLGG